MPFFRFWVCDLDCTVRSCVRCLSVPCLFCHTKLLQGLSFCYKCSLSSLWLAVVDCQYITFSRSVDRHQGRFCDLAIASSKTRCVRVSVTRWWRHFRCMLQADFLMGWTNLQSHQQLVRAYCLPLVLLQALLPVFLKRAILIKVRWLKMLNMCFLVVSTSEKSPSSSLPHLWIGLFIILIFFSSLYILSFSSFHDPWLLKSTFHLCIYCFCVFSSWFLIFFSLYESIRYKELVHFLGTWGTVALWFEMWFLGWQFREEFLSSWVGCSAVSYKVCLIPSIINPEASL